MTQHFSTTFMSQDVKQLQMSSIFSLGISTVTGFWAPSVLFIPRVQSHS